MRPRPAPGFIPGPRGRLFAINWRPTGDCRGSVICIPPFAEEMNRCRRSFTELCMAAAGAGWSSWQFDLFGTGDSEGDFGEASWSDWLRDISALVDQTPGDLPRIMIGFRAGALLAGQWLASEGQCDRLVLWQPVVSGKMHLQQFLRLRVMANRFEGITESVKGLLDEVETAGRVEVAGYALTKALCEGLQTADISNPVPVGASRIDVLETGASAPGSPGKPLEKAMDTWRAHRIDCGWQGLEDAQCWASQEIVVARSLVARTLDLLQADAGPSHPAGCRD